ncbi:NAD-dependent epimerase/dehydratase family protein [Rhodalgimonas zhirmunskyi]|uniref:NAD-dependent epimerase/dehydratase family protein n=1 Tax=Rhodalgimonas zhirmunskyi TaxID=2964767 RepID=A0AAJ1U3T8_9RHOB|nr:NAD-dependent epimerase/dehydratase family protein [Rhodoalgimonas zhirmunskyi]MDQ2093160.1 NAD-dependent epimerase/dehydratase family protein [Rhodoalgimonas zhirmunskyi]
MSSNTRTAIIGAGYIADWHADAISATPGVDLVAVCDTSSAAANGFAAARGITAFTSLDDLIASRMIDAVHITTPPSSHAPLAIQCLNAGLHVLVEKPVALSASETQSIEDAAQTAGKLFCPGHNFLGIPSYARLKDQIAQGKLGRISTAEITWAFPLGPLRAGPYGLWLMRETKNLLLELGPHLFAFAQDLFGPTEILHVEASKPVSLPGGGTRPQVIRIMARAGNVDVNFLLSLVETHDDRALTIRGSSAMARLDYANDVLTFAAPNAAGLVVNPLRTQLGQGWQNLREGLRNAAVQFTSLNQKSPYGLSFRGLCAEFYAAIAENRPLDARFRGATAIKVMQAIDAALPHLPADATPPKPKSTPKPDAMVIGGTGFIGRALTRKLVEHGHDVRVLSRGKTGPFDDIADHVETVGVSLSDEDALTQAMQGIKYVFNLAKSMDSTWDAALKNDVGTALRIARAAQTAGVERLVYTGTIASYDMSDPNVTITEDTPFGDMSDRNIYARSKAECERQLMAMHKTEGLPLTIARPAIVVGEGGPLQHWGIGRWHGAGAVKIWGDGNHILPFALIDDTAEALVRMIEVPEALGESFNLAGEPMFSARDYFDAIHDALGARIKVSTGPLWLFYGTDAVKFLLKTRVLRRRGLSRPSLKDWKSRAHYASFDNSKAKRILDWHPVSEKGVFVEQAITKAGLMGF